MITIGVCARSLSPGQQALLDALADAFGVAFDRRPLAETSDSAALIVVGADRATLSQLAHVPQRCFVVPEPAELRPCGTSSSVSFANSPAVDGLLRGRTLTSPEVAEAAGLPEWLQDRAPLALKGDTAVWATEQRGRQRRDFVALPLPELMEGEALFRHFSGQRFAQLLPLVLFLRSVVEDGWEPPPVQASLMFDDPNLHWTSYGFIDYEEMVRNATRHNYHVSIATIPLDAWFVHRAAAALFKKNARRVSLLYHGNDHLSNELARYDVAGIRRVLPQAVARIAGLEARADLEVASVMAPPHGACAEVAMAEMARCGFEAVCVSRGSLAYHNRKAPWLRTLGIQPCDLVAGLPVIPRFRLDATCQNDVLLAALLRQPIIPMTHHEAVADGYGLLNEVASFVNSLGDVNWADMKTIGRSLYARRRENDTLRLRMYSRRVSVKVPDGVTRIHVEHPDGGDGTVCWKPASSEAWKVVAGEHIPARANDELDILSGYGTSDRLSDGGSGRRRLAPVARARRLLTEGRDRALPSFRRLSRVRANSAATR